MYPLPMTSDPSPDPTPGPVPPRPTLDSHLRSQLALEAAGVGTWIWEITSNSLIWDEVTYRLFGVTPEDFDVRRESMEKLIHPDDMARVRGEVEQCSRTGADFSSEYRVIWPRDHSVHFLRAKGKIYRNEDGAVRLTGACWDITTRKALEDELSHERFLLRTLAAHIPDKIYFKDEKSRFTWLSHETLKRFGTDRPADVIGKTDFDFFREQHAKQAFEDEQRIVHTGEALVNLEEFETWADGRETWVSTTKMPLRDERGNIIGTFGLSRDITERKRAEQQLARYAEELRRRNEELEEDLSMARELQQALLPRLYPCFPRNASPAESALQFSHYFNPSTSVSGDFFDLLQLSDNTVGIFVCDVMGHGMRAALVAAIVRALVEELKELGDQPGRFLLELNRKLFGILKQTDITMFASASYVVADIHRGEFRYANAGHPHPLCVRHEGGITRAMPLNHYKRGPVLGLFDGARYDSNQHAISPRDIVLSFTDGLFEVEGRNGQLYDEAQLVGAVNKWATLTGGDLCREVLKEVRQFSANQEFNDDVCLVSMEVERLIA